MIFCAAVDSVPMAATRELRTTNTSGLSGAKFIKAEPNPRSRDEALQRKSTASELPEPKLAGSNSCAFDPAKPSVEREAESAYRQDRCSCGRSWSDRQLHRLRTGRSRLRSPGHRQVWWSGLRLDQCIQCGYPVQLLHIRRYGCGLESLHCWQNWNEHLNATVDGALAKFRQCGMALLDVDVAPHARTIGLFEKIGIDYQLWDATTLVEKIPGIDAGKYYPPKPVDSESFFADAETTLGALYTPQAGFVDDPQLAAANLAAAARSHGAVFAYNTRVVAVEQLPERHLAARARRRGKCEIQDCRQCRRPLVRSVQQAVERRGRLQGFGSALAPGSSSRHRTHWLQRRRDPRPDDRRFGSRNLHASRTWKRFPCRRNRTGLRSARVDRRS